MLHVPSRWLKRSLIATTFLAAGVLALGGAAEAQARHGCGGYGGGYGGGFGGPGPGHGPHASYYHGHGGRGGYGYGPRPVVVAPPYGYGAPYGGYRGYYGGGSGVSISFGF